MIRSLVLRYVSYVALASAAALALPATASAQQAPSGQPPEMHFTTSITQVYGSQYPITGRLDLQFFPGGHLRGYYHTSYYKLYIDVVGGRDGDYIWFDIGPSSVDLGLGAGPGGKLHIVATMNGDGSFRGQVYPETASQISGLAMQYQAANPQPTSNDQYLFSATPSEESAPTPQP